MPALSPDSNSHAQPLPGWEWCPHSALPANSSYVYMCSHARTSGSHHCRLHQLADCHDVRNTRRPLRTGRRNYRSLRLLGSFERGRDSCGTDCGGGGGGKGVSGKGCLSSDCPAQPCAQQWQQRLLHVSGQGALRRLRRQPCDCAGSEDHRGVRLHSDGRNPHM